MRTSNSTRPPPRISGESCGHSSTTKPPTPSVRPIQPRAFRRSPFFRTNPSISATHNGTMATINAANPLGTYFSE